MENKKGKMRCTYVPDYILFDLETTGISCNCDEVIEISAVKVRAGKIVEEFDELVNPGKPIPGAASMVNHISDEMVADAQPFCEILPRFLEFAGEDVLVGHNIAAFDMKFLNRDCERYLERTLSNDYIDTLKVAKLCFPEWKHRRLGDLAEYYGISTSGAHRALTDCKINQQVFERLAEELEKVQASGKMATEKTCPDCGLPMKKRKGRFGEFWGCTGYPGCRHTENIK